VDPENIKAILATQFNDFGKGERFHHQWKEFLGDSIFATDGQMWHNSRQLIRPQFLKERIADLHTFERHIQEMFKYLPMDGSPVDIADFFYRYTLDNATDFLLGHSVGSLHNPKARFAHAFQYIQRFQNNVARSGPFWRLFNRKKYNEEIQVLNDFVNPFVEKTLQMRPEDLKPKTDTDYNFLHALAEFTTDRTVLRDQLVAVLLAARDTTAATMSWLFHEISQRPDVVRKIRAEILETVGPTEMPTYAQLKNLKYLMHVINETLR
jgi:cytochrome P450